MITLQPQDRACTLKFQGRLQSPLEPEGMKTKEVWHNGKPRKPFSTTQWLLFQLLV